jgi:glycosyltransferase involved in cell wall biosynthesis
MDRILEKVGNTAPSTSMPDISIVVPVNAQGDLENIEHLLSDFERYDGPLSVETILVVNNYPPDQVPPQVRELRKRATVLAIPSVRKFGEAVAFSGRVQGMRVARSRYVVVTDADCRIPNPTAFIDWYHEQLSTRAHAAYTHVEFQDYDPALSVRFHIWLSHALRWIKREILRIPVTRGASYGMRREELLKLYDAGVLADEMNVGPAFKRLVGPVAYGGGKELEVLTSGRMFKRGWWRAVPYFVYRLRYNLRVLPVRPGVAGVTGRENDPVRRYRNNRPIRDEES